ncbi:hypothetical protein PRIPAC_86928 [Pristionchus pacificus]|uniref:Transducin-like enhancer protein 6 n=1 Tax=Pristionchus pacificus TaxID=54126 RepID=A0A2A6BSP8_PRIPA|nr:hypothetical protein PRIPAC_86928 [Pristionchus pacificus]|eukprot:PDM68969.1 WD40 domain-containing protein [Pristionchus pacificus]
MQGPIVHNGKKSFMEALDKIKEDYNRIEAQTVSQRSELERLNMEKMQVAQQQMMVHQLGYTTNMELQKQTEAAQRLTTLLNSVLQYASPELQATAKQTLERAQQPGALGGPNGMNMMAMNGAMGSMQQIPPMGTPNGTPARAPSVKRERRSSSRATMPEKKPKIEAADSDEEIDVTSNHAERESSVFSDISSASTLPRSETIMRGVDQFPMAQFNPAMALNGMMPVPNGKTVSSVRYDEAGNVSPTVFPPDVLTDPAVPKAVQPLHYLPHRDVVCAVAMTKDAKRVFTGGKGAVKIWDLAESSRAERATFTCGTDNYVRTLKINQTGNQIAIAGEFPAVMLFDIETQRQIVNLETGTTACYAIAVDNESKLLYACCENGTVVIFDLVSMREVSRLIGHKEGISCLELSGDGQHLWTGGLDHTVRTWNTRERREESKMDFSSQVFAVSRSPVDEWLAVGLDGKQVEVVNTLPGAKERYSLAGHNSCVLSLRYAHSGRWFCSTGKDDTMNLWTSPHGALAVQRKEDSAVLCCEISQDDGIMVTGSKGTATVYEVTTPPVNRGPTGASLKPIKIANRGECLNMCANLSKSPARSACKQVCSLEFPSQVPIRPTPPRPIPRG